MAKAARVRLRRRVALAIDAVVREWSLTRGERRMLRRYFRSDMTRDDFNRMTPIVMAASSEIESNGKNTRAAKLASAINATADRRDRGFMAPATCRKHVASLIATAICEGLFDEVAKRISKRGGMS